MRESMARQGKSTLLLLQTEQLQLDFFHTSGFLGKFLYLREKKGKGKKKGSAALKKKFELDSLNRLI